MVKKEEVENLASDETNQIMSTSLQLSEAQLQALNYEMKLICNYQILRRLMSILLSSILDLSYGEIGAVLGLHADTVGRYVRSYRRSGLSDLLQTNYRKNVSELDQYAEQILADLDQSPPKSINEARSRIYSLTGILRSPTRIKAFMARQGLRFRKVGYVPGKADPDKQEQWLKETLMPHYQEAKAGLRHLFFMDAAHFTLGAFVCKVWSKTRKFIRSGAGRNRINVLGAVNAITHQLFHIHNTDKINAEVIMDFLTQLRTQYRHLPISIVLDNARYQHCKAVTELAQTLEIDLLFLPAYSPNLNLIERLWKVVKKQVLYAKYFETPQLFHHAIISFCSQINTSHNHQLKTSLNFKFQTFDKQAIYQG